MIQRISTLLLAFFMVARTATAQTNLQQEELFAAAELKADLLYLKSKLESNHPNLYLYTSKPAIDNAFDSLNNSIAAPLTALAFYKHVSILSSILKDGHTVILPAAATQQQQSLNSFLPYHFVILDGRLYIDMVFTDDKSIPVGSLITSINDVAADDIVRQLSDRMVRDGDNLTYPTWILNNYFRQYYGFMFGYPVSHQIRYAMNGKINIANIKALTKDSIDFYRSKYYPKRTFAKIPGDGITLKMDSANQYAVLTIKDFHNDVLKKEYKQKFDKVIPAYFDQILESQPNNLVLDLRNNQGGDIENGVLLLSYLLDKPFSVVDEYFCVADKQLAPCNGPSLGQHQPKPISFKGKLYVLINGGSFSNSGIVASCLRNNGRAAFIGQETGGNPNVIAGFIKEIELPNTKIQVQVPTRRFQLSSKANNNGRGITPEHLVSPTLANLVNGIDTEMEYTIRLIKQVDNSQE